MVHKVHDRPTAFVDLLLGPGRCRRRIRAEAQESTAVGAKEFNTLEDQPNADPADRRSPSFESSADTCTPRSMLVIERSNTAVTPRRQPRWE
jgi:hypothetical protein